jgi:nucleotide-binding universal stress UspA family protein
MENILCPIDFSKITERVIAEAVKISEAFSCKLWLLHVAAPDPDFVGYSVGPQHERDWRALDLRKEHRFIQEQAIAIEKKGIDVTPLLVEGATIETILNKIKKFNIDMVVMGTHGHGSLYSMLMGSVSTGVLKSTKCPILFVPLKGSE